MIRWRRAAGLAASAPTDSAMPASAGSQSSSMSSSIWLVNASSSSRSCSAVRASASATPGPELGLEHGQHPLAHAHAGEGGIGVVRVVPRRESGVEAGLPGGRATDAEQRPRVPARAGGHAGEARGARAAGEPEQHGLGLVVERVAEQHERGSGLGGDRVERGVAGVASGCLGAALARRRRRAARPRGRARAPGAASAAAAATSAEASCSPWSTITAPARSPARGASNAVAAASASESAPPESATSTSGSRVAGRVRRRAGRGDRRVRRSRPATRRDSSRRHPEAPPEPRGARRRSAA